MRIVYDDAQQQHLAQEIRNFVRELDLQEINRASWDYDERRLKLCDLLRAFLWRKQFEVGKDVRFARRYDLDYPVFYHPESETELQLCGYVRIRRTPGPKLSLQIVDYNLERVSPSYEFHEDCVEEVEYERF